MRFMSFVLSGILMAGAVFAQQGPRQRAAGRGVMVLQALKNYLNLSDDQVTNLKNIETAMRDTLQPLVKESAAKRRTLRAENQKANPDANVIAQLKEDINSLRDQIQTQRGNFQKQLQGLLNPDQLASLADLEKALRLLPAARAAAVLNLIDSPNGAGVGRLGPGGPAGPGMMMRRGQGN